MSSRASSMNTYTRSAILAWANAILATSHPTFQDIPSHEVGLLLHGIFNSASTAITTREALVSESTDGTVTTVPLLSVDELRQHHTQHQSTCMQFLQLLQFPAPSASHATAETPQASNNGSSSTTIASLTEDRSVSATAVTQQRNAEHVLAMIRALSAEEAALLRASSLAEVDATNADGERAASAANAANVVLILGPSMTPTAWLSGSAFVEELKLWRWVRLMADRHRCTTATIRATIAAYVRHDGALEQPSSRDCSPPPSTAGLAAEKRRRSPSRVLADATGNSESKAHMDKNTSNFSEGDAETCGRPEINQELKRMRPELLQSPVPAPTATTASASSLLPLQPAGRSVSPVHALLSPIREADRPAHLATAHQEHHGSNRDASPSSSSSSAALRDAMEATATTYVAQSAPLHTALQTAQATLQHAFQVARDRQQQLTIAETAGDGPSTSSSSSASSSSRSSTNAAEGALESSGVRHRLLPAVANSSEAHETAWRQRMVAHVFPTSAPADGKGGDANAPNDTALSASSASVLTAPPSCGVCPALMAHAVQCNLNAIDVLEEARAKAIAACLKKDPVALLAALQNIA